MLGVHFAITADQEKALLDADGDDDAVGELLGDIEENWDDDQLKVDTDKAWDEIHRCLTDGSLDPDAGDYPLSHAILGGHGMHDDYYVVYVDAAQVRDVAAALRDIDRAGLRQRFDTLLPASERDYDFELLWTDFADVVNFYQRAAAAGRAVLFTAT
ncbi:hypothetical protein FHR83_006364 [Actinoplanes campanulatus]|uniref:DUF1877 family protein n=1 Tax=Actinoplanes campanulatus TaxID=113559 RepID=A0A7W5FHP3_9ACTN|nr:YfbM family protein [Actinoplanes campanulatus]MBB3098665.1 hypothetical protein [Actinoplanes campanulatus]GGN36389.1 hypothetical protein GCM10010109_61320 [Actinoplanes campanulatus]GID39355.1 hypothetical protein Aca09nite_58610 [Actinoplanes campanulatus]